VCADRRATRDLKIELLGIALHAVRHLLQNFTQRFVCHRKIDAQKVEACAKAREVFPQREEAMPFHAERFINPVAEINPAVERGDHQLLQGRKCAVIVPDVFHTICRPVLYAARHNRLPKRRFFHTRKPPVFARFEPFAGVVKIDFARVLLYHIGYSFSVSSIIPFLRMRCNR